MMQEHIQGYTFLPFWLRNASPQSNTRDTPCPRIDLKTRTDLGRGQLWAVDGLSMCTGARLLGRRTPHPHIHISPLSSPLPKSGPSSAPVFLDPHIFSLPAPTGLANASQKVALETGFHLSSSETFGEALQPSPGWPWWEGPEVYLCRCLPLWQVPRGLSTEPAWDEGFTSLMSKEGGWEAGNMSSLSPSLAV